MSETPTLADIQEMDVLAFVQLVRENLGFPDPRTDLIASQSRQELWVHLTAPEVIERTSRMLIDLMRGIDDQLATRRAAFDVFHQQCVEKGTQGRATYFQGKGEYEDWRSTILETKRVVALRYAEAKRMAEMHRRADARTAGPTPPNPVKGKHNLSALFHLAYVVVQHRDTVNEEGILPLPHDLELWQACEKITVMFGSGEQLPLTDWVERAESKPDFHPPTDT